jgi:hypothetical protein
MRWQICDAPWPASVLHHIGPGEIIEGITDKWGALVGFSWNGAMLPVASTALPLNACACDQASADELVRQHPDFTYRLRAVPPAVIQPQ